MTTDFRALCAELLREFEHATHDDYQQELKGRARAALAEPHPEPPTDEELLALFDQFDIDGMADVTKGMPLDTFWDDYQPREAVKYARAVLARWGS